MDKNFKVNDIVQYRHIMTNNYNWGVIIEIFNVEDSVNKDKMDTKVLKVEPLGSSISFDLVSENDILKAYSEYYIKN